MGKGEVNSVNNGFDFLLFVQLFEVVEPAAQGCHLSERPRWHWDWDHCSDIPDHIEYVDSEKLLARQHLVEITCFIRVVPRWALAAFESNMAMFAGLQLHLLTNSEQIF